MKLYLNGEKKDFPEKLTLTSLIDSFGMDERGLAVELNAAVLPKSLWAATQLKEGDRVEIVQAMGGG